MNWILLEDVETLDKIKEVSHEQKVLLFKHSIRCSISAMAKDRLERAWNDSEMEGVRPFLLDLVRFRHVSNSVAEVFGVVHQSPQVLLIDKGQCVYDDSHFSISYHEIKKQLSLV